MLAGEVDRDDPPESALPVRKQLDVRNLAPDRGPDRSRAV
jgi:hypothetical protein